MVGRPGSGEGVEVGAGTVTERASLPTVSASADTRPMLTVACGFTEAGPPISGAGERGQVPSWAR